LVLEPRVVFFATGYDRALGQVRRPQAQALLAGGLFAAAALHGGQPGRLPDATVSARTRSSCGGPRPGTRRHIPLSVVKTTRVLSNWPMPEKCGHGQFANTLKARPEPSWGSYSPVEFARLASSFSEQTTRWFNCDRHYHDFIS